MGFNTTNLKFWKKFGWSSFLLYVHKVYGISHYTQNDPHDPKIKKKKKTKKKNKKKKNKKKQKKQNKNKTITKKTKKTKKQNRPTDIQESPIYCLPPHYNPYKKPSKNLKKAK